MPKGPPTSFVPDARGNVVNGLRVQKAKNRDGRSIDRFLRTAPCDAGSVLSAQS